jgi:hypothetical protein
MYQIPSALQANLPNNQACLACHHDLFGSLKCLHAVDAWASKVLASLAAWLFQPFLPSKFQVPKLSWMQLDSQDPPIYGKKKYKLFMQCN